MIKDIYVFLRPEDIDGGDPQNHHVIEARQDSETGEITYPNGLATICNGCTKKRNLTIPTAHIIPRDDENIRSFLAEKQDEGKQTCANCVRHFYADND